MIVTFISDTHCHHDKMIENLPAGDILIFSGDCMSSGYDKKELIVFLEWLKEQPYRYKICIPGNHDRYCSFLQDATYEEDIFERYIKYGIRFLCDESIVVNGLKIYGTPFQPYFYGWAFNVLDPDELYNIYKKIPNDLDILITHCPPYDILDKSHIERKYRGMTGEEPLGSKELTQVLKELGDHAPRYHVFGHIHGDGGKVEIIGNTTYINASICDEGYYPVNSIVTMNIDVKGGE